jgi:Mrp family chromosome partitioning ATPase
VIILDSPPTLAVSDVALLAPHASHVLMAIRWKTTTRAAASKAISVLKRQACPSPMLVLTQVEHANTSRYEEGRYGMNLSYQGRRWQMAQDRTPNAPPTRQPAE